MTFFCAVCGKDDAFFCKGCMIRSYCSLIHQKEDWPRHKKFCKALDHQCFVCKKNKDLLMCLCKHRYYCSKEHQAADWNDHKVICKAYRRVGENKSDQELIIGIKSVMVGKVQGGLILDALVLNNEVIALLHRCQKKTPREPLIGLLGDSGSMASTLGRFDESQTYFRDAIGICMMDFGAKCRDNPRFILVSKQFAMMLIEREEYSLAKDIVLRAHHDELCEEDLFFFRIILIRIYLKELNLDEVEVLLKSIEAFKMTLDGEQLYSLIQCWGHFYELSRAYKEAVVHFHQLLKSINRGCEGNRRALCELYYHLSIFHFKADEVGEAMECSKKSLYLMFEVYGERHFRVLGQLEVMAIQYACIRQYDKAIEILLSCLDFPSAQEDPEVHTRLLQNLLDFALQKKDPDLAVQYLRQSRKPTLRLALTVVEICECYREMGEPDMAEKLWSNGQEISRVCLGNPTLLTEVTKALFGARRSKEASDISTTTLEVVDEI